MKDTCHSTEGHRYGVSEGKNPSVIEPSGSITLETLRSRTSAPSG